MRVLITGADGFAGRHLIHELASSGHELHGTSFRPFELPGVPVTYHTADLRDETAVADLIAALKPDHIYHLAAQASPARSYSAVWSTLENNIRAQLSVILACLTHSLKPRILVISSGDIYGEQSQDEPATEDLPFHPSNPYSVSKVAQDMLALQYYLSNDLPIMRARPFNHLGPGQSPGFVAPDFALQIAKIEAGQQLPTMRVGSLNAERDFTDVRDVVRAYRLIMEHGEPGEVYNIASGRTWTIRAVLDMMLALTDVPIAVESDTARLRPGGTNKVWGDASRLRAATGWQPTIPLEQTVRDVLDDCRQRVRALIEESKMKAITYHEPGDPLLLVDMPDPVPDEGELLVRVRAAGVNRADLLQRRGGYSPPPGASPILGLEIAGEVVEPLGGFRAGDRVMAVITGGGYAELATVPLGVAMRIPDTFSFDEAAAIPEAFLTTQLNLFTLGKLHGHESVLVHAGGSGVGTAAIQMAKATGAFVFTTAGSAEKLARCRELGADITINYKEESFLERIQSVTDGRGVDVILDFVGAPYWNDNLAALAVGGRLILIGFLGGAAGEMSLGAIMGKSLTVAGTTLRRTPLPQKIELTEAFVNTGIPLLESGRIAPVVDRIFALEQANEAHRYMQNNSNFGKIVLTLAE